MVFIAIFFVDGRKAFNLSLSFSTTFSIIVTFEKAFENNHSFSLIFSMSFSISREIEKAFENKQKTTPALAGAVRFSTITVNY